MRLLPAVLLCLQLLACSDSQQPDGKNESGLRVVSLAPHITELLFSVGAADNIVGVVAHSDFPEQARTLPVIGDAFRIDPERLAAVEPDLIFAWQGGNPPEAIEQLKSRGYRVVSLPADSLQDVAENIIKIGSLTGHADTAKAQARQFSDAMEQLAQDHSGQAPVSVFYQISRQPLYTVGGGHPISDLIQLCGGQNIFDDLQQLAPVVSLEQVLLRNPDVIITGNDNAQLEQWSRWKKLSAAREQNLFMVDASLVTRSSLRLLQGARQICAHLATARQRKY
ncbi:MAG: cobalamin-binding protein [Gammaproteobacteria bacterium]|nr:cobalamin-binding protein [Gammaproteobacteria bacterium]NNF67447.1 cobalamin-binding protein [Gammaproteobacteria bacterium]